MFETHYVLGIKGLDLKNDQEQVGLFSFTQQPPNKGLVKLVSPLFSSLNELAEKYLAENMRQHPYVSFYKPHEFPDFVDYLEGYYGPAVFFDKTSTDQQNKILNQLTAQLVKKKSAPKKRLNPEITKDDIAKMNGG